MDWIRYIFIDEIVLLFILISIVYMWGSKHLKDYELKDSIESFESFESKESIESLESRRFGCFV
jgi:hypothetical protein